MKVSVDPELIRIQTDALRKAILQLESGELGVEQLEIKYDYTSVTYDTLGRPLPTPSKPRERVTLILSSP